jgi:hypothetical protein
MSYGKNNTDKIKLLNTVFGCNSQFFRSRSDFSNCGDTFGPIHNWYTFLNNEFLHIQYMPKKGIIWVIFAAKVPDLEPPDHYRYHF